MRYLISIVALLALAVLPMAATGQAQGDGVRRITATEAHELVAQGKAVIVDVRSKESYNSGHVKDALWINLDVIGSRVKELPRDKMIITYCT
jgi:rhodanese-related sulfurtransferase